MRTRTPRTIFVAGMAVLGLVAGSMVPAGAQQGPVVTLPTAGAPVTSTSTSTSTTAAPATTAVPTTVVPTTLAETKIILMPETRIAVPEGSGSAPTTTTPAGATSAGATPPPSLNAGQVADVLRSQQRSGVSSTAGLVEALLPLQAYGMTAPEALALGMGQFPVLGVANWTDSWLDPRDGPPPHQHQGNDIFAAFDAPVRAPVDGVVRFEVGGLGGNAIYVTAPDGTYYYLAHLSGFVRELANGATVTQGQVIGYNGDSGNARGGAPHVHFEVHPRGGAAVDPKPFLDAWLAAALAGVPGLLASFQPTPVETAAGDDTQGGVPQILVATGLTRRFSTRCEPAPSCRSTPTPRPPG